MTTIYGGDEVNALVLDLGSNSCKAGYAGDDTPKAIFPSAFGAIQQDSGMEEAPGSGHPNRRLYLGHDVTFRRDNMEVCSAFSKEGLYEDWEAVEQIWGHAMKGILRAKPEDFALMVAEPSHNTRAVRHKMVELLFEKFTPPAVFLAKNATLCSYAVGRPTSLVVDSGHDFTTVSAVHDGYLLQTSVTRSPLAGCLLTKALMRHLQSKDVLLRPRGFFKRYEHAPGLTKVETVDLPNTPESFKQYLVHQIVADIKESTCRTSDSTFEEISNVNIPTIAYELPDGSEIQVGPERFKIPELMFQPQLLDTYAGLRESEGIPGGILSLPATVLECINKCDVDIRRELYTGILLSGGNTLYANFKERVESEIVQAAPQAAKIKVLAPQNSTERRYSTWIGGSILASLGSFQQLWMSKQEYDEHGAGIIDRKAP